MARRTRPARSAAPPDDVVVFWQFGPDRFTVEADGVEVEAPDLGEALNRARRLADRRQSTGPSSSASSNSTDRRASRR
jgi:hypothetical protein